MSQTRLTEIMEGLRAGLAALTPPDLTSLAGIADSLEALVIAGATPTIYNVAMTNADTEYSQALPANCKAFALSVQGGAADKVLRCAFATGKVAAPTAPYYQLPANAEYYEHGVNLVSKTLYFACSEAGKVAQIVAWV